MVLAEAIPPAAAGGVLPLWAVLLEGWRAGGLAFVLFLALLLFFTGQVSSRRQADAHLALLRERYEENAKLLEKLWADERARAERLEQQVFQLSVLANRAVEKLPTDRLPAP